MQATDLSLRVLASGSNGNCYLANWSEKSKQRYLLIDCGINQKRLRACLDQVGVDIADIEHILITHEHQDHLQNLSGLITRTDATIWLSAGTWVASRDKKAELDSLPTQGRLSIIAAGSQFSIGDLIVTAQGVPHDARETLCYGLELGKQKLAVLSDLGYIPQAIGKWAMEQSLLVLEFNHDYDLLMNGHYPPSLKDRVSGDYGHLNNGQSKALLQGQNKKPQQVIAVHLSEKNNDVRLVKEVLEDCGYQAASLASEPLQSCYWIVEHGSCTPTLTVPLATD